MATNTAVSGIAFVLGSSRGVGKAIADELRHIGYAVPTLSRTHVDTSDLLSVERFVDTYKTCDVLVLNTGGPPKKNFADITARDWEQWHNQLFVSFNVMLQRIVVRPGGYIFLISSHHIKEPAPGMILSQAYRLASWSVLKALTKEFAKKDVSCVNLALGPILTDRLRDLNADLQKLNDKLPMGRAGDPSEVGRLVRSIVEENIKYLSGVTINFDGGLGISTF